MKRKLGCSDSSNCSQKSKFNPPQGLRLIQQYNDDSESSNSDDEGAVSLGNSHPKLAGLELTRSSSVPKLEPELENVDVQIAIPSRVETNKRFALPSVVATMFGKTADEDFSKEEEVQSIHEGRIRSFPHIRGNWASYVYIPFGGPNDGIESISTMSTLLQNRLQSQGIEIRLNPSFHLSLSRTVVFHHHWLDSFIQDLKKHLDTKTRFTVVLEEFDVFVNDERTRTFIGMSVHACAELHDLVDICDSCFKEYNLEGYYKDRRFHISIGWVLGDQYENIRKFLPEVNEAWEYLKSCNQWISCFTVNSIEFKYGNKLSHFNLTKETGN